jgi:hypothetical protein
MPRYFQRAESLGRVGSFWPGPPSARVARCLTHWMITVRVTLEKIILERLRTATFMSNAAAAAIGAESGQLIVDSGNAWEDMMLECFVHTRVGSNQRRR